MTTIVSVDRGREGIRDAYIREIPENYSNRATVLTERTRVAFSDFFLFPFFAPKKDVRIFSPIQPSFSRGRTI